MKLLNYRIPPTDSAGVLEFSRVLSSIHVKLLGKEKKGVYISPRGEGGGRGGDRERKQREKKKFFFPTPSNKEQRMADRQTYLLYSDR